MANLIITLKITEKQFFTITDALHVEIERYENDDYSGLYSDEVLKLSTTLQELELQYYSDE